MRTITDIFFELPVKFRPLLLDSEYHPRGRPDQESPPPAPVNFKERTEAPVLPRDWQIGDPI